MASLEDESVSARIDALQSAGQYTFALREFVAGRSESPVAVSAALRRLKKARRIVTPRRGFFTIVPLEYRSAGCPPASWFIEDLMRFLGQPYYVGLLSAAAIHGAAHQQPMRFQVVTDRTTRVAKAGRIEIDFHSSRSLAEVAVQTTETETGTMRVATPETTAFDLIRFADAAGHLSNVATVLSELAERIDRVRLANLATVYGAPETQRLGFVLDQLGQHDLAEALHIELAALRVRPIALAPRQARSGKPRNARWQVIGNFELEPEA